MTAQEKDKLTFNDEVYYLATEPLMPYLQKHNIKFETWWTACWRGYTGNWIIEDNKLYLVALHGWIKNDSADETKSKLRSVDMNYLFPDQEKVFAEWFTGEIRIPYGEMLQYYHIGYASVYEKELYLEFENGYLIGKREKDNKGYKPKEDFMENLKEIMDMY